MESQRPTFSVIGGRPDAPVRIALSLVHRRGRIDIPVRDVLQIDARADETFYFPELRASRTYPGAHVKLTLKPDVRARLYRLTRDIVGDPLEILVAGEVISSPIVREPLGIQESLIFMSSISPRPRRLRRSYGKAGSSRTFALCKADTATRREGEAKP
jgi:hypothetical protein